jgi:predicted transcriptional regulator
MVNKDKYSFSFTGASALITETLIIAEEYKNLQDWKAVKNSLMEHNSLNKIKQSTFKREFSEIKKRLSSLSEEQLYLLINGTYDDSKAMILLSLIKVYTFLNDFIVEVLRNKYLQFDTNISENDYFKFVNSKCISHNELNEITEVTTKKVKQVIFKLLEQVGLVTQTKNGTILKPILSLAAVDVIINENPIQLSAFLYSNEEIKGYLKKLKHA